MALIVQGSQANNKTTIIWCLDVILFYLSNLSGIIVYLKLIIDSVRQLFGYELFSGQMMQKLRYEQLDG